MNSQDPLADIRDLLGSSRPIGQVQQEVYPLRKLIGAQARFKGKQELRVSAVGHDIQDQILLETADLTDSTWKLSRWVRIEICQVPGLLRALLQGEVLEANISVADPSAWPEFPIPLADIPYSNGGALKVILSHYKGFLDIRLSMASADGSTRRNNLWAKLSPVYDARPIMVLLIEAHDEILRSAAAVAEVHEAKTEMDF